MNIAKEKIGACRWKVTVELPADFVQAEYENVLGAFMRDAEVEGFRSGRAPRALVENKYSKYILDEVKDRLLRQAYRAGREQEQLEVVHVVDLEEPPILIGQPARFVFTVDVAPTFDLPEYRNIPVKSRVTEVTSEEVVAVKQNILRERERWEKVEGRPVQLGDIVIADYEGICEGKPLSNLGLKLPLLGKGENVPLPASEFNLLPGLGKALVGAQVGERKEVWIEFPQDFEDPAVAGKKCTYFVNIKEIHERKVEPLDEAFLARYGVKSEAELEEKIREGLRKSKEDYDRVEQKNQIYQFLLQRSEMELPMSEVDEEVRMAVRELVDDLLSRGRNTELTDQERDELIKRATAMGITRVKLRHILRRIAKAENVEVKPDEVRRALASIVLSQGGTVKDIEKASKQPQACEEAEYLVLSKKVSDWLLSQAKVEKVSDEGSKP